MFNFFYLFHCIVMFKEQKLMPLYFIPFNFCNILLSHKSSKFTRCKYDWATDKISLNYQILVKTDGELLDSAPLCSVESSALSLLVLALSTYYTPCPVSRKNEYTPFEQIQTLFRNFYINHPDTSQLQCTLNSSIFIKKTTAFNISLSFNYRLDLRQHFFSERVVDRWNRLDQCVIDSATVNSFKNGLRRKRQNKMGFFVNYFSPPGPTGLTWFWRSSPGTGAAGKSPGILSDSVIKVNQNFL